MFRQIALSVLLFCIGCSGIDDDPIIPDGAVFTVDLIVWHDSPELTKGPACGKMHLFPPVNHVIKFGDETHIPNSLVRDEPKVYIVNKEDIPPDASPFYTLILLDRTGGMITFGTQALPFLEHMIINMKTAGTGDLVVAFGPITRGIATGSNIGSYFVLEQLNGEIVTPLDLSEYTDAAGCGIPNQCLLNMQSLMSAYNLKLAFGGDFYVKGDAFSFLQFYEQEFYSEGFACEQISLITDSNAIKCPASDRKGPGPAVLFGARYASVLRRRWRLNNAFLGS